MSIVIHRANERGGGEYGWLKTNYSFSFANWYEPTRMGFGKLRVINDDWIAPHEGFGAHSHKDMEIMTLVTSGVLTHEDSMGNHGVITAGDVQVMSAGSGVTHSERNDEDEPLTLFQIWIEAKEKGISPRYDQRELHLERQTPGLRLIVGPLETPDVLTINQDAYVYHGVLTKEKNITYQKHLPANVLYLFVLDGDITVEDQTLKSRDALGISDGGMLSIETSEQARILLFEVTE